MSFNEEFRFGSASWADEYDLRAAGVLNGRGLPLGFFRRHRLNLEGDAPLLTIGGAGSGKLRDLLGHVAIARLGMPFMWLDPRGEIGAISIHTYAPAGEYAWFWNPMRIAGLPAHSCNPLDILDADDPRFHADTKFVCEGLIALSGSSNGQYFELRAREWLEALLKAIAERDSAVSFRTLWQTINQIEGDPPAWADRLETMLVSRFEDVRRIASEMLTKQQDSPKEFGSIMGEIYAHLSFLSDPSLLATLDGADFSLKVLCENTPVSHVFLNVPAEYLKLWSPLLRTMFTVTMLYKSRAPNAKRVTLVCDEAGQAGRAEFLLSAFSYGRGFGVRAWALFQDIGQIARNFDRTAVQSLIGNAQVRQFFGVRDYETAKLVSEMLGSETLSYDNVEAQEAARRQKWMAAQATLLGEDVAARGYDYSHFHRTSQHRAKQARALLTADEVLNLSEDKQLLFISGKNLKPILADKRPYYALRSNAGRYLANPYHPPIDRVRVNTLIGSKWVSVVDEEVPEQWADFPQYQSGRALHVKGYRL